MDNRRVRAKTNHPPSLRLGLRSSSPRPTELPSKEVDMRSFDIDLPHHIVLEVLSFLDARAIVRTRQLSRAFRRDAPTLIDTLEFTRGQQFPSAKRMKLFPRIKEVKIDGDRKLVHAAAAGLRGCASCLCLDISLNQSLRPQEPLCKTAVKNLCALPLTELESRRIHIEFPASLKIPVWQTLQKLLINDAYIADSSLINLLASIPAGPLPLRHLDLSRNLFGDVRAVRRLAAALRSFPDLERFEVTAGRISCSGAKLIIGTLLDGACPKLKTLDLSLNFVDNGVLDYLSEGLRTEHQLQNLRKLGIGGRSSVEESVTSLETLGSALAAGGLPLLDFLHLQGDVGPAQVGPLLRKFRLATCPNLAVVKLERSNHSRLVKDAGVTEDAIHSMHELITSPCFPHLKQLHVLGMNLSDGLEMAEDDSSTVFYRARFQSAFHRLAVAGAIRGVMIFV